MQKLYKLQKEIKIIIDEYDDICCTLSLFNGSIDRAKLLKARDIAINKLQEKLIEKEKTIDKIEADEEVKMILRLRLRGFKWREISRRMNYSVRTCKEKYYKYERENG